MEELFFPFLPGEGRNYRSARFSCDRVHERLTALGTVMSYRSSCLFFQLGNIRALIAET